MIKLVEGQPESSDGSWSCCQNICLNIEDQRFVEMLFVWRSSRHHSGVMKSADVGGKETALYLYGHVEGFPYNGALLGLVSYNDPCHLGYSPPGCRLILENQDDMDDTSISATRR